MAQSIVKASWISLKQHNGLLEPVPPLAFPILVLSPEHKEGKAGSLGHDVNILDCFRRWTSKAQIKEECTFCLTFHCILLFPYQFALILGIPSVSVPWLTFSNYFFQQNEKLFYHNSCNSYTLRPSFSQLSGIKRRLVWIEWNE